MTEPYYSDDRVQLFAGDCRDVMAALPDASVHAVCTDPPYELAFMGKTWDSSGIAYDKAMWAECLRVLKPGGHLLAFGGTRTYHRMTVAIEDAGFEIRDSIHWIYGSGFPKSLDVSKAIDKANGRKFEDRYALGRHIGERRRAAGLTRSEVNAWFGYRDGCEHWERQDPSGARVPTLADWRILRDRLGLSDEFAALVERVEAEREVTARGTSGATAGMQSLGPSGIRGGEFDITAPATPEAAAWSGWGTALKPAHEPIVVARKPLVGTVAGNVLAHGTGALNIDGCRVEAQGRPLIVSKTEGSTGIYGDGLNGSSHGGQTDQGRWPANVVFDEAAAAELDRQSGASTAGAPRTDRGKGGIWAEGNGVPCGPQYGDTGGASRFFPVFRYEAKAPTVERPRVDGAAHATVKPLDLMRWLVRLVTPPGGTVLDPFAGSGTTAEACVVEGFHCIAIELDAGHLPLIKARLGKPIQPVLFGDEAAS